MTLTEARAQAERINARAGTLSSTDAQTDAKAAALIIALCDVVGATYDYLRTEDYRSSGLDAALARLRELT